MFLDFSSYDSYVKCPRKFAWANLEGLEPKGSSNDESLAGHFKGTVVHECINALYEGKNWEHQFDSMIMPDSAITQIPGHLSGSVTHLKNIVERYITRYTPPNDPDFEVVAIEQHMQMPLAPWLTYVGTVDKLVIQRQTGEKAIIDHKTSSSLKSFLEPTIPVSDQFTGYLMLAQVNNFDTNTVIVDGISTALKSLKENEGLFNRYCTIRSEEQIDEYKARIIRIAERMREDIETGEFVSHQPGACTLYNTKCQFYDVCSVAGSARLNLLRNGFKLKDNAWKNFKIQWAEQMPLPESKL